MPIPIEFAEVWFAFRVTGDNETMYTHLAYGVSAPVTQAGVNAGFLAFQTAFKTLYPAEVTLLGGHLLEGTSGGSARWEPTGASVVGTGAFVNLPNNCAYLVKKTTASGGRRNRGRMFFPSPDESGVDAAGNVLPARITSWNAELAKLMTGGTIHTAFSFLGDPALLHEDDEEGPVPPTTVTSLALQTKIATQRRRMRR